MRTLILITIITITLYIVNLEAQEKILYPQTKKTEQTDTYFGTKVDDPYRWLEETGSAETREWIESQNRVTFGYLEKIPYREKIKERLTEIWDYPKYSSPFKAGEYYFFYKNDGLQNQDVLYIQKGLNGTPEVFLDPNTLSKDGTAALVGTSVSKDKKYIAYSLSLSGSDIREIHVVEIATKKRLADRIEWVKFSNANWYKDGFFYTTYGRVTQGNVLTEKNQFPKVYYHKLGTNQGEDLLVYKDDTNPKRSHYVWSSDDEKYLYMSVNEQGQKGNQLFYRSSLHSREGFIPLVTNMDFNIYPIENFGDKVYFFSNENAPNGKVTSADINNYSATLKDVVPEFENSLDDANIVGGKIINVYMKDVTDKAYVYDLDGKFLHEITLPAVGNASGFNGSKDDNTVFYDFVSMTAPKTIYIYDIEKNESKLFRESEVNFDTESYESKQVFYSSKDGTKIPMFIVHKKGLVLDGTNPTFLYGYGGFSVSMKPNFSIPRMILLENGGVYAMACIRGGGEYGKIWHEAGTKLNKQNVFDDFIYAAEYLISEGYTSPGKLACAGGSNGGLLVGAVINQRPELFKVAIPMVGVMDMLRYHKFTIGAAWSRDYGTSEESEEMFRYLLGYSPLHNITVGINYPAVLVTTADHDDRVVPSHSFKYAATLQEKYSGDNPVLIRIETKAGHSSGKPTTKIIQEATDMWSFVLYNLGVKTVY